MDAVWHSMGALSFNQLALANFTFWKKRYDSVYWISELNEYIYDQGINVLDRTYFLKKNQWEHKN